MNQKIFKAIFSVATSVLILGFILFCWIAHDYSNIQIGEMAQNEIVYLARGIEKEGLEYLDSIELDNHRITWVDSQGNVLFDNQQPAAKMENHLEREEIREAMAQGTGQSTRYSTTMAKKTINYAIQLNDGSVLRLSQTKDSVWSVLFTLLQPMLFVLLIAIVLSAILARYLSNRIVEPLNHLDLDEPSKNEIYEELNPLIARLEFQKHEIQKRMELLTSRQNEFRTITENMKEGLIVLDSSGNLLSYNCQAQYILDFNEHLKYQNISMIHQSFEISHALNEARLGKALTQEIAIGDKYYQLISNPVMENEKSVGVVMMIWDITETHAREALRREFSANVSHELKTPLTSISGYAEIIQTGIAKSEDICRFAGKIYDESKRLLHLVNDIIQLSELDEKGMSEKKSPCALKPIIQSVVDKLSDHATKASVKIYCQLDDLKILGIDHLLYEMFYNIIENAIKYNKENGEVYIKLQEQGDFISFSCKDNGIGIPFDMQERVFERFYRVDKSHSKEIGGTGLGLSIVKHGANIHHATIQLDSILSKGTKLTLHFPKYNEKI